VEDIDSSRMLIRVRNGKGQKDRYAKLSPRLLAVLRDYYSKYKPVDLLFRSRTGGPMTRAFQFSLISSGWHEGP
jgi:integrase